MDSRRVKNSILNHIGFKRVLIVWVLMVIQKRALVQTVHTFGVHKVRSFEQVHSHLLNVLKHLLSACLEKLFQMGTPLLGLSAVKTILFRKLRLQLLLLQLGCCVRLYVLRPEVVQKLVRHFG